MRARSSRGGRIPDPFPGLVVPGRELRGPDDWPRLFGRSAALVVEIGFGKDTFLLDRAEQAPGDDHVGVERDPHRVRAFLRRAAARGLANVRALPVTGELALSLCLPAAGVSELHVYFPDPWPKARHADHRMVRRWFARETLRVLRPGGAVHLATDDADYACVMLDAFGTCDGFTDLHGEAGFSDAPAAPLGRAHRTKFERLWRLRGRTIRHLAFQRVAAGNVGAWSGSGAPGDSTT